MLGKARAAILGVMWCGLGGDDKVEMFFLLFFHYDVWVEGWFLYPGVDDDSVLHACDYALSALISSPPLAMRS